MARASSTYRAIKAVIAAGIGSETPGFSCGNLRSIATVGFFPDGSLAEAAKHRGIAQIALHYGVSRDDCRSLLPDPQAAAKTPLGVALDLFAED